MNRFARQEGYIKGLAETYKLLMANTEQEINCLEQSSEKHKEMLINQKQLQELCEPEKQALPEGEAAEMEDDHPWTKIVEN